ncbi:MAG: lipopolysaccharide biosynthesis protein [Dysgonamonadaceae bacterium]|jgi:O-antigen/teichoic acid export membrane protein|nr:lipopolysaccharide biosynthesis protein [Dysgonamonadaceae bacterium]
MSDSSLKQKTANGLLWGGVNNLITQIISLVFGILLARALVQEDYGLVGMLAIFTALSMTIVNSGFSTALTNKKDATQKDYDAVFWFTVFVGIILFVVLYFCAPLIASFYKRPELISISKVLFLGFMISGIGIVSSTVLFKRMMVKEMAIINIVALCISSISGVTLALLGYNYWALVIQNVLYVSSTSLIAFIVSPWRPTFHINFSPLRELLPFSAKLLITSVFYCINTNILSVLLGKMYNATMLGDYSQGQKWGTMGSSSVGGMINSIAQPVFVQINDEKKRQLSVLRKMIRFGAFLSFPLMFGFGFVGKEFILITIGERWLPSVPYLQLFCIWGAFAYLWNLFYNTFFAHGKSNIYMYITIITGILQLIIVLFIYKFINIHNDGDSLFQFIIAKLAKMGVLLIVIGYLLINFISLWLGQYHIKKLTGLRFRELMKDIVPYLSITLACLLIAYMATITIENLYLLLIAKVVITATLYVIVMKVSRSVIFKESMEFLFRRKNN